MLFGWSVPLPLLLTPSCEKGLGVDDVDDGLGCSGSEACGFGVDEEDEGFEGSAEGDLFSSCLGAAEPSMARRRARI